MNSRDPLYFIALMPPSTIRKEVETIKKEIKSKYGIQHALKLPAHITLQIPFRMSDKKEPILIRKLQNFFHNQQSWKTELEGFGKFAKRVIFIQIKEHEPYEKLHQELQEFMLKFLDLKSHEISTRIHPHITIATRDLKRSHFPEIWEDFEGRTFNATFKCEHILLLKHNGKTWDQLKSFSLAN